MSEVLISEEAFKILEVENGMNDIDSTLAERGNRYGTFIGQADIAQTFKKLQRGFAIDRKTILSSSQQEALDMIFNKIARILNGDPNYADSWHDIAGYATLIDKELNNEII